MRICEDPGIERWESLLGTTVRGRTGDGGQVPDGYVYRALVEMVKKADKKYNSGLFHFSRERGRHEDEDTFTPGLSVDDDLLARIIKALYPPFPYRFDVIPVEILGQVYEQFLGKVIVKEASGGITVQDKTDC